MRQILCYGDSNTYGLVPKENARYPWGIRWTSRLNEKLGLQQYRVIEEGLCGRTTVFDDPFRDHRNGAKFVNAVLETHGASDLIILMLGTNDCKTAYKTTPQLIGKGVETVIAKIRNFAPDSKILLVSPIHLGEKVWEKSYDPEFSRESVDVSKGLADVYAEVLAHVPVHLVHEEQHGKIERQEAVAELGYAIEALRVGAAEMNGHHIALKLNALRYERLLPRDVMY